MTLGGEGLDAQGHQEGRSCRHGRTCGSGPVAGSLLLKEAQAAVTREAAPGAGGFLLQSLHERLQGCQQLPCKGPEFTANEKTGSLCMNVPQE